VIRDAPEGFEVLSGNDNDTFPLVCLGGSGVIAVASHLAGERMHEMVVAATAGDVGTARKINDGLQPLYKGLFVAGNPISLKAALQIAGRPVGEPRLPLVPATEPERALIRRSMEDAGVL
jgi:4-hydroxy-tetrahydrodipicolinate synthase